MTFFIRHYWGWLTVLLGFCALAATAPTVVPALDRWFVETTRQAGFVLTTVSIEGNSRTPNSAIQAQLDIDNGMPLLAIDLKALQERLEKLPWVKRSEITRVFPGDLEIKIIEKTPFALWQQNGMIRLIDPDGQVIIRDHLSEFAGLLKIVGDVTTEELYALLAIMHQDPKISEKVETVVRVGERRWDLIFANGIRLKLPEDTAVDYDSKAAWKKFVKLQSETKVLDREVSVIDMRFPDRAILRVTPAGHRVMDGKEWST